LFVSYNELVVRFANPEKLYADFFAYGKRIGKNLKLGNEIEAAIALLRLFPS
jgi:hypothetical protein